MVNGINTQIKAVQTQFEELQKLQKQGGSSPIKESDGPSFDEVLTNMIKEVDQAQQEADTSIKQLAAGESTSIQDVVMKMEEADIAFQLMKEIRTKLLDAYKEVISMS